MKPRAFTTWLCLIVMAVPVVAAKRLHSPKGSEQQIRKQLPKAQPITAPMAITPRAVIRPPKIITNTLAWDYPSNWNQIATIRLYRGSATNFISTNNLGKVLSVTITRTNTQCFAVTAVGTNGLESEWSNILRVPSLIVHVTVSGGATNIYHATSPRGPWSSLGTTNYWITNQFSPHYYRGKGKAGNRAIITATIEG